MENGLHSISSAADVVQIPDVAMDEIEAIHYAIQIFKGAACEVVEDADRFAMRDEALDDVRSDEAGSSGYQVHGFPFVSATPA